MATTDTKQELKDLLTELFQLNNTDLDFGIYRILNLKAQEVNKFINEEIDATIENVKSKILSRQSEDVTSALEAAKAALEKDFKIDFEKPGDLEAKADLYGQLPLFTEPLKKYKEAKEKLDALRLSEDTEKAIYNELFRFFDRYYEGGDFISKPRAGKNNYLIPYEGEEVKLYWANHDQYYIKTGDNFKNYAFNNEAKTPQAFTQVEFKILDAETAQNNNKEEKGRLFVPAEEPLEWLAEDRKLLVKFYYKVPTPDEKSQWGDKQSVKTDNKGINQKLFKTIADFITGIKDPELLRFLNKTRQNAKKEAIPLIQYHLERYTTVNKFDYFIHKDLKGFLRRELDFFLKNEVLSIQFLSPDWQEHEVQEAIKTNVIKTSAIRDVALNVIEFIGELEDFQKRLFEKKKFVVQSDYCLTLDRIPAEVYDEVTAFVLTDPEKQQLKEWKEKLNFITPEITVDKAYLQANDKLVLDTAFLPDNLKWKLLAAFDNLDEQTNGLLINSENWQALNLLQTKYKGKIALSYIDPPYNTGDDGFPYKDGLKSASWLSMIHDRITQAKKILSKDGLQFIHIDFHELNHLFEICNQVYGEDNLISMFNVKVRHESRILKADKDIHEIIEQVLAYKANFNSKGLNKREEDNSSIGDYVFEINFNSHPIGTIKIDGWDVEVFQKDDYEIKKSPEPTVDKFKSIDIRGTLMQGNSTGRIYTNHLKKLNYPAGTLFKVIGMGDDQHGFRCIKTPEGTKLNATYYQGVPKGKEDTKEVPYCTFLDFEKQFNNARKEAPVDFTNGKKPIKFLQSFIEFGARTEKDIFLDYFGGSGSFAHATINHNKKHRTSHKYIVIEMGDYFYTKTLPTVAKASFSTEWKNQIPLNDGGTSQLFQYLKLEQYEDTLNNIEFRPDVPQLSFLDNMRYQLRHGANHSLSLLSIEKFTKPFAYSMQIVQQNEAHETTLDLVTTFNFLLGIEVVRYQLASHNQLEYRIVFGKKGKQAYIIVWRTYNEDTINLTAERDWITTQDWFDSHAFIYCNGDNAFGAHPTEPEFIRLMNEPAA